MVGFFFFNIPSGSSGRDQPEFPSLSLGRLALDWDPMPSFTCLSCLGYSSGYEVGAADVGKLSSLRLVSQQQVQQR